MEALATDQVAYVRFASVYLKEAKDFEEFITDELAEEVDQAVDHATCAWRYAGPARSR